MRALLIETACNNGHHECLVTAGNLFNQWRRGLELNPEIRGLVYTHGLRVLNDEESWDFVWQKYLNATNPDEISDLQRALALVKNSTQIERFIEAAKSESVVRKHEYFRVLRTIAEHRGFPQVTSLIFNNWTDLVRTYGGHKTEVFAYKIFKLYDTEKDLKKVRDFYRKNKVAKDGQRSRTLAIENILENIRWQEMHKTSVKRWLEDNVYMPWKNSRLPRHILPSKYDITLHPNIMRSDFEGSETVAITISEPTDYLLFHELALKILSVDLIRLEGLEEMEIDETFPYKKNSFIVILFKERIPAGEYLLKVNFTGIIEERGDGLGRYPYYTRDSEKRYMLASKFEPIDARKMFPCFDEPDMKAKFKLAVIHEDNYTAISNMPVEDITLVSDNKVMTTFQESVIMSTYLLCCVVSDFDYIESEYKGKKVRAYAPSDSLEKAEHGLNITIKVLEKFEEYFDIPYVLPKLDSVAIPFYKVPAMEHWGIITYQDRNFLIDSESTLYTRMLRIDRVISHELAHQWFGNLVTMKWWNDLWLNEGFATLIMYMPLIDYYPAAEELEVRKISRMMCIDSTMDSRPIIENVSNMADISDLFDQIRYEKGSAVMRMLKYTLKDDFRKGLSNYLKKYAFKNAETMDLWEELSNASSMDLNITEMMKTWTLQMGFPYIELKRNEDTLSATQRWFLRKKNDTIATLSALTEKVSPFGFVWKIPLIYKNINTGNEYTLWLNERNATFRINAMKGDIVKFNPNFVGYYIVKYDEDDYSKLAKRLQENHTIFSAIDRYNLLYDAFLLAESDRLLYDVPLEFTKYLRNEKELMPWMLFRDKFSHFLSVLDGNSETAKLLKDYARKLTEELYNEVVSSKNDSSHLKRWESSMLSSTCALTWQDIDLTETITDLACRSANEKCLNSLNEELDMWLRGENITAHIYLVLSQAIPYYGNQTVWNMLYDRLVAPNTTDEEKNKVLLGLVSFTGRAEIMNTIDVLANDPAVDSDLARDMFERMGSNPHAAPALWNYAKTNWKSLLIRFDGEKNLSSAITLFCQTFKTTRDLGGFVKFLKGIPQVNDYILENCITDIQDTITWSEKYEAAIQTWLRWNTS